MAHLTIPELQDIKTHMISDDEKTLTRKFKSRKNEYDTQSIDLNEIDDFEKNGWEVTTRLKHKAKVQRRKPIAVAYTHLDVYKRQPIQLTLIWDVFVSESSIREKAFR